MCPDRWFRAGRRYKDVGCWVGYVGYPPNTSATQSSWGVSSQLQMPRRAPQACSAPPPAVGRTGARTTQHVPMHGVPLRGDVVEMAKTGKGKEGTLPISNGFSGLRLQDKSNLFRNYFYRLLKTMRGLRQGGQTDRWKHQDTAVDTSALLQPAKILNHNWLRPQTIID